MSRIGVDLDGVLYDFGLAFKKYLTKSHKWPELWCSEIKRWEFYEDWGISLAGFKRICHEAADTGELWNACGLLGGSSAQEALEDLKAAGHKIHIITHRGFGTHPSASHVATARWLGTCSLPYDTLTFSEDKTLIKTDWMIEDNADNYVALEKSGCKPVLITRPWNEHLKDARRVTSVREFVDMVNA